MPDEMTHERCSELLAAYAADRLDPHERGAVDEHLVGCPDCSAELAGLRALTAQDDAGLSELERARLHRRIKAEFGDVIASRPARPRVWTRLAQGLGAAALLAIVGVGIAQLGTGQSNDEGNAVSAPKGANDGGGGAEAGGANAATGADTALAPLPRPSFQHRTVALTDAKLAHLGKSSAQFRSFSQSYSADDAVRLKDAYLGQLAADASTPVQKEQVRACAGEVFDSTQSYSLLPAYAAGGRLNGKDALVLGFAWTDQPRGPLDKYMLWVWPVTGCGDQGVPLDYSAGPIGKK